MEGTNWICPYCGHHQTLTENKKEHQHSYIDVGKNSIGKLSYSVQITGCSNPDCGQVQVVFGVYHQLKDGFGSYLRPDFERRVVSRRILPDSEAKPQPDYIPQPIRDDYREACLIKELSPKASATLARRCLQGMIRDFCGIKKARLNDEIEALRKQVAQGQAPSGITVDSVDAIDHVRRIGNIGAHMEKDINLVIDVEPHEAQALIELIESLFEDWYVARKTRQDRFASVKGIADAKADAKAVNSSGDNTDSAANTKSNTNHQAA